jgi:hypothetical protein
VDANTAGQNSKKNQFMNPVIQNNLHIRCLKRFLRENVPIYSVIVFSERCELKKVMMDSRDIYVVKPGDLAGTVREIIRNSLVRKLHQKMELAFFTYIFHSDLNLLLLKERNDNIIQAVIHE